MAEYQQKKVDSIGTTYNEEYILWHIGPVWAIEQPQVDDPSFWRFFDQGTARATWDKLKAVKRGR